MTPRPACIGAYRRRQPVHPRWARRRSPAHPARRRR